MEEVVVRDELPVVHLRCRCRRAVRRPLRSGRVGKFIQPTRVFASLFSMFTYWFTPSVVASFGCFFLYMVNVWFPIGGLDRRRQEISLGKWPVESVDST